MQRTLFGTDGIRTTMGQEPLTTHSLIQLGNALGHWMKQHKKNRIVIAHDTRISCSLIKSALKTGLLQHQVQLTDACVLPTPVLFFAVKNGPFDVGIMITASHNQYQDNGLKIFTKELGKTTIEQEQAISNLFHTAPPVHSYEQLGMEITNQTLHTHYIDYLKQITPPNFLQGATIALDSANGAFHTLAPAFLQELGANVMSIGALPNGKNINENCGSLHPETLQSMIPVFEADIGFAFDGDGDRVTVIDYKGTVYDGDHILALLLENPTYQNQTEVVSTVMANQGLETHVKTKNKTLVRTTVGDKNVLNYMKKNDCLIGGEPSGHIILRDFMDTSDALFTTIKILETLRNKQSWNIKTFKNYPQVLINVPVKLKKDLSLNPYAQIIKKHQSKLLDGRLVVRYSGTEPLLRVMIEDQTKEHAETIGALLSQELTDTLAQESK